MSSEPRKNFSCIVDSYLRTVSSAWRRQLFSSSSVYFASKASDETIAGNIIMIQIPKFGICHINWTDLKGTQSHGSLYW
jgi:hypothetical protein